MIGLNDEPKQKKVVNIMSEKGVVFTAESIQAILAGTKNQTRRVVTPQPIYAKIENVVVSNHNGYCPYTQKHFIKRKYAIGDIIWVRETWTYNDNLKCYGYKASWVVYKRREVL